MFFIFRFTFFHLISPLPPSLSLPLSPPLSTPYPFARNADLLWLLYHQLAAGLLRPARSSPTASSTPPAAPSVRNLRACQPPPTASSARAAGQIQRRRGPGGDHPPPPMLVSGSACLWAMVAFWYR
jgi:hypothetical protein